MKNLNPKFDTAAFLEGAKRTAMTFDETFEVRRRDTHNVVGGIELILRRLVDLVEEASLKLPLAEVHPYVPGQRIGWQPRLKETSALEARVEGEVDFRVARKLRALRRSRWALLRAVVLGRW